MIRRPRGRDSGFLTAANLMSLSRIPLGVSFLAVDGPITLTVIVAIGALTDLLDGMVARVTGTRSRVGALLDPFCDRVFVLLGLVSFLPAGHVDWAGFVILVLRDIFTGGVFVVTRLVGEEMPFHSRPAGKVTTALQVTALFTLILAPGYVKLPIVLVGVMSVVAIIDYGMTGIRVETRRGGGAGAVSAAS